MRADRRMVAGLALSGALALAGCASEEEQRAAELAQAEADRQECRELGFQDGTEAFSDCMLKLREIRAMERYGTEPSVGLGLGFGFGF